MYNFAHSRERKHSEKWFYGIDNLSFAKKILATSMP